MPKLIMLDHSLAGAGGHNYEYALNVLRAAAESGWNIVLAANEKFEPSVEFPRQWQVLPVFRRSAYNAFNVFGATCGLGKIIDLDFGEDAPPPTWLRWWERLRYRLDWRNLYREHRRRRRARYKQKWGRWDHLDDCLADCRHLFQTVEVVAGDMVFVPTLTELDLEWIVQFLKIHWRFPRVPWHLQFHFNFLEGREPDYAEQDFRLDRMRRHFRRQLAQIPAGWLRLHTTTEELAAQYNRLGVGEFRCLPYPVNPRLRVVPRSTPRTLRAVIAGCIRVEKGCDHYQSLIAALWKESFVAGRLQLVLQIDKSDFAVTLPDGRPMSICNSDELRGLPEEPVIAVRAPLDAEQYARLIETADVGVFLYDSQRYYTRCSGVLVEMLACGVPVIVPAGSWLSEQIAESIAAHLEAGFRECTVHRTIVLDGPGIGATTVLSVPPAAEALLAFLSPGRNWTTGSYLRVTVTSADVGGASLDSQTTIVGRRKSASPVPVLLQLTPGATSLSLTLENAFHHPEIS